MNRTVEQWAKSDPELMAKQSEAAIFYAFRDAKQDIASLAQTIKGVSDHNLSQAVKIADSEAVIANLRQQAASHQRAIRAAVVRALEAAQAFDDSDIAAIGMDCGLGRLTEILDDDQWSNIEPMLLNFGKVMHARGASMRPTAQPAPMPVAEKLMPMIEVYADLRFRLGTGQWTYEQRIELAAQADQARSALKSLLAASIAEMTTPRPRRSGESMKTVIRFVPYTPAGTPLDWLASDTESDAWKKLLEDAAHMPYKTIENFKKRGYVVEREKWTEKA